MGRFLFGQLLFQKVPFKNCVAEINLNAECGITRLLTLPES